MQHRVWNFLLKNIQQAEVFISHPIDRFIPQTIDASKVALMPASTDPLDGLNKPLPDDVLKYYLQTFNRWCMDQMGTRLFYPHRPYIIQIARFDPSKGKRLVDGRSLHLMIGQASRTSWSRIVSFANEWTPSSLCV